jgi:2-dehydro-3-deoxygluconokinase
MRIVTFGEAMLRFTPPGSRRLEQADAVDVWAAGAELNVAVAFARLGGSAAWVSRLPRNALARKVDGHARSHGVDTSGVHWADGGRLGLFFTEVGRPPRPSATLYDRADSAFALLDPAEFDWPALLDGARAFHTSGITPALAPACARATAEALGAARELGCHTSYDLNYRSMLTSPEGARGALDSLAPDIDTVIASSTEVAAVYGLTGEPADVACRLRDRLGVARVVVSRRLAGRDGTQARRSAVADGEVCELDSPEFRTVDPLGGGDAFSAGLLLGMLDGGARRGLELGGAVAALKQSIPGDFAVVDLVEVEKLIDGGEESTRR